MAWAAAPGPASRTATARSRAASSSQYAAVRLDPADGRLGVVSLDRRRRRGGRRTAVRLAGPPRLSWPTFLDAPSPMGYGNAAAALFTMGALPAIALGALSEVPAPLGAAARACRAAPRPGALTTSRGWLVVPPIACVAAALLVPGRVRLLVFALPVAAAVALSADAMLAPFDVAGRRGAERRSGPSPRHRRGERHPARGGGRGRCGRGPHRPGSTPVDRARTATLATRTAGVVALGSPGPPSGASPLLVGARATASERVADFKDTTRSGPRAATGSAGWGAAATTSGASRSRWWRDQPLVGVGQDNFAQDT